MSMELKKTLLATAIAAGAFTFSHSAQAACSTDTANEWECVQVDGVDETGNGEQGPFNFSGSSALSVGFISATCTLSLDGTVEVDTANNRTFINVTSGTITGAGTCNDLSLNDFTWEANEAGSSTTVGIPGASGGDISPANADYATGDISNIQVVHDTFGTLCDGELQGVTFRNNPASGTVSDPSEFNFSGGIPGSTFLGNCNVNGTLSATGTDVNVW